MCAASCSHPCSRPSCFTVSPGGPGPEWTPRNRGDRAAGRSPLLGALEEARFPGRRPRSLWKGAHTDFMSKSRDTCVHSAGFQTTGGHGTAGYATLYRVSERRQGSCWGPSFGGTVQRTVTISGKKQLGVFVLAPRRTSVLRGWGGVSPRWTGRFSGRTFREQGPPRSQGAVIKTSPLSSPGPELVSSRSSGSFCFCFMCHMSSAALVNPQPENSRL